MYIREQRVICPSSHQVPNIYNECTWGNHNINPFTITSQHLKSGRILEQQCDSPIVSVCSTANPNDVTGCRHRWISK
ncbi:hypothetical protein FQZ97_1213810 [compost metagenome]